MIEHWGTLIILATIVGMAAGWIGASFEHIAVLKRMNGIEGFLRGLYAMNARRAKKEELAAPLIPRALTDEEIMELARRNGLLWATSSRRSEG